MNITRIPCVIPVAGEKRLPPLAASLAIAFSLGLSACQSGGPQVGLDQEQAAYWNKEWRSLPEKRRATRITLASRRVLELKTLAESAFSKRVLESFVELEPRLFLKEESDADVYPAFMANFGNEAAKRKQAAVQFLKEAKPFLDNPASDQPALTTSYPLLHHGAVAAPARKVYERNVVLTRYGYDSGRFLSEGDPAFEFRAMPGTPAEYKFKRFRVLKALTVKDGGRAAPWFGQAGGANQAFLGSMTVRDLLNEGFLVPIAKENPARPPSKPAQIKAILNGAALSLITTHWEQGKLISDHKFSKAVAVNLEDIYRFVRKHGLSSQAIAAGEREERYGIKREADGTWKTFYFEHGQRLGERTFPTWNAAARALIAELHANAKIEINSVFKVSHPQDKLPKPSEIE